MNIREQFQKLIRYDLDRFEAYMDQDIEGQYVVYDEVKDIIDKYVHILELEDQQNKQMLEALKGVSEYYHTSEFKAKGFGYDKCYEWLKTIKKVDLVISSITKQSEGK